MHARECIVSLHMKRQLFPLACRRSDSICEETPSDLFPDHGLVDRLSKCSKHKPARTVHFAEFTIVLHLVVRREMCMFERTPYAVPWMGTRR